MPSVATVAYDSGMKPLPAPEVPGKSANAVWQVLTVSKEELLRREAEQKRQREHKQMRRKNR